MKTNREPDQATDPTLSVSLSADRAGRHAISVGLAGWGGHGSLYAPGTAQKEKLARYAEHFRVVEMDNAFYGVQPPDRMARYAAETPDGFGFIVKAYQDMTGHQRGKPYYESDEEMYRAFRESLVPLQDAGKLTAALFQYPPWFDCTRENVRLLRETKKRMAGFPCALEFRHQSWFAPEYREKTLDFMRGEGWIHVICDEPQAGPGSVPIVPVPTDSSFTLVRMHGRNISAWNRGERGSGKGDPNHWREVRYLYDYNKDELAEWRDRATRLLADCSEVCVIFNNNSGGHAAGNAKQFMHMLGMPLPEAQQPPESQQPPEQSEQPEQLDLFGK